MIETAVTADRDEEVKRRWLVGGYEKTYSLAEYREKLGLDGPEEDDNLTGEEILEKVYRIFGCET